MTTDTRIFHCRATGLTLPVFSAVGDAIGATVLYQGQTFTVTPEEYEMSKDRIGLSWLDLSPEQQVKRWGMVKFAEGPPPEDLKFAGDDEGYQYKAGTRAREQALLISNPVERAEALAKVRDEYGTALTPVAQGPQYMPGSRA